MALRAVTLWCALFCFLCLVGCGGGAPGDTTHSTFSDASTGMTDARLQDVTLRTMPDAPRTLMMVDGSTGSQCHPTTCAKLGVMCGPQGDGCGGLLECGSCTLPETCGGGGHPNVCGTSNPDAGDGSTGIPMGPLTISPQNMAITVPYGTHAPTVTYSAAVGGHPVSASFSIDLGQVAAVNASSGVVTPSGVIGGVVHVTATFGMQSVSTPLTVTIKLVDLGAPATPDAGADAGNFGGNGGVGGSPAGGPVSMMTQTVLEGTPVADASFSWLYPYDKTVWPQGILPPLLQWATNKTYDGVYVQLAENAFVYQGFFATPSPGKPFVNIPLLKTAWDTLVYSNQGEPVVVTLTFSVGNVAYGPVTETWTIAQGTLTGTVYYNSYGTALAINYPGTGSFPPFGGATLAIKHGATSPVLVAGTSGDSSKCRVCHSVAAGGSTLITQHGDNYNQSSAYNLSAMNAETPVPPANATVATYAFPAIYPDGTFLLSDTGPLTVLGTAPGTSSLFSIAAGSVGTAIGSMGLPMGFSAATPIFSPDGSHIAFNQYGVDGVSLGAMAFDNTTKTFSPLETLDTPMAGETDVFPAFFPTNDAVVFERQITGAFGQTRDGAEGQLWWVDLATHTPAPLATLNGMLNGMSYLPNVGTNHGSDQLYQYEPTVNPVASGGYAWVVFTSRRAYGNVANQDPMLSDPRNYNASLSATTKKLWVAAIDLNAAPGTDPSHPAFYLPAQELFAGNSRGYWVVDPCEASGASCLTGDQCCSGYCGADDAGAYVCGTQPPGCAVLGNKCTQSSDCCGSTSGISCIDGFCAQPGVKSDAGPCTPTTCGKLGFNCGPAGDGCGGLLECGTCMSPDTCGGGGASGVCGAPSGPP